MSMVRSGGTDVEAVARALLSRISAREPEVRAWAYLDPPQVVANARALDRLAERGPLHGVPIAVKDVLLTQDMPTRYNSAAYSDAGPTRDAACVALLRAAGALIVGKTETVEFASTGRKAPTHNPHDLSRTPGASSSGSAAAVADMHVPLAIGTQTGGSMIRPASFCGVFAIKPTWGVVSAEGAKVSSPTLDTIGWFARSVADLRLIYDVLDPDPVTAKPLDIHGARVALCRSPVWDQAEPATRAAMTVAEARLRKAGAEVIPLDLPEPFHALTHHHKVVMGCESRASFLSEYRVNGGVLHPNIRAFVENAGGYSRDDLRRAYDGAAQCRERFDALARGFDAILTPSAVGESPVGLQETGAMTFNAVWTLLHVPCVNVPGLVGPAGMPVGLTVTGPRFADRTVMAAAEAIAIVLAPD
jgi:Asp-tRNA(Asn)/Glu-tRNA(Gln) amidotransferase A subunit family amidase